MAPEKTMTGQDVQLWVTMTIECGMATNDETAAKLLGVTRQTLSKMKREGADRRTDLACRAILLDGSTWSNYVKSVLYKQPS